MTYAEKLKDPRWQKRRLEIMAADAFACRHCGSTRATLHVHHAYYEKGRAPWEYEDEMLMTLCEPCHAETERVNKLLMRHCAASLFNRDALARLIDIATDRLHVHGDIIENFLHMLVSLHAGIHWSPDALAYRNELIREILRESTPG